MNRYKIYCTKGQIKKALELGAPIEHSSVCYKGYDIIGYNKDYVSQMYGIIPTAEEMFGWLEEQGVFIGIVPDTDENTCAIYLETKEFSLLNEVYNSREEAILASIDAALDYLIENKNKLL